MSGRLTFMFAFLGVIYFGLKKECIWDVFWF